MEAADHHAEAAVLWLAQAILGILFAGKMEAWIREAGLTDDIEGLKSELERVEAVVPDGKGRAIPNRPLARSLGRLKELLYDADDMVDELDYYRLQHQVQGGTNDWANQAQGTDVNGGAQLVDGSRDNSGIPNRNDRKKRSKAWEEFSIIEEDADGKPVKAECIHCRAQVRCETTKGTSVLHNHLKSDSCKRKRAAMEQTPNPSSAAHGAPNGATIATYDSGSRKRMRTDQVSAHNPAASTDPWNKTEFCNRIQQTTSQLKEAINEVQKLYGSSSVASSNLCQNTAADPCRRTSSLLQRKMFGRDAEKDSIIKHMTGDKSNGVIIIPIVGIGGIGKTALTQIIYNDPVVKSQFDLRMWIWVSSNFDEVRLTREMLDFVSQEKQGEISSLAKLQEILVIHVTSKRCLLILDDIWDDMDDHAWNKILALMQPDNEKSNVILVTTRKLSIANAIGTIEPIKLSALRNDDFLLLFKACSFGDGNHDRHPSLNIVGQQIAMKLYGNPLAAVTVGTLLRVRLTVDHWSNILKNEKWKSLHLNKGIMCALKLSYDELPYYLQQCFLCCSIFPKNYQFRSNELIYIWIAQGFVKCGHSMEMLEEIGWGYITDLVNSCFFEQVETEEPTPGYQTCYVMPALVHDFAKLVSRTECAALDGLDCNDIPPTIRHFSILTDSAYHEDQYGDIPRNIKFEEKLQSLATSVRKLRTLVLIGKYDSFFFQSFQDAFNNAHYLRSLQISATCAEFDSFLRNSVNSTHHRYLKLEKKGSSEALPIPLSKFYHLQALDVGHATTINDMSDLVSMRHLVIKKGAHFINPNSIYLEMTQLQSMNELVHLGVHQLQNVNGAEVCGAKLRDKQHLRNLHLSWKDAGANNILTSEQFTNTAKEVLEGLEPHQNLKHLRISGYSSATSPNWFSSVVLFTFLQTLHLEDCGEWQALPSLERLPFLTKLELRNMSKLTQVTIPPLEELVLTEMPNLERCSCNSTRDLNSSLRVLMIERCDVLKAFPLFESFKKLRIEHKSWLSGLSKLTIHDCPLLIVSNALLPSSSTCKLSISRVSTLPHMEGSSNGELRILGNEGEFHYLWLMELDDKKFSFHNLRALTRLEIEGCDSLSFISLKGFKQLISLKSLEIHNCMDLFSSDVLPEQVHEDTATANFNAFPALKHLRIVDSRISGKWLSVMLRHAPILEELHLDSCKEISGLLIEGKESCLSNHNSSPRASSPGNPDDASTSSAWEGLVHIPSNHILSLKKLSLLYCDALTFLEKKASFSAFISLEELEIEGCPKLISSFGPKDENSDHANGGCLLPYSPSEPGIVQLESLQKPQLCPRMSVNCLKKLGIYSNGDLESLKLDSYTTLEELIIEDCDSLTTVEDLQSLRGLRYLTVRRCPRLPPFVECLSRQIFRCVCTAYPPSRGWGLFGANVYQGCQKRASHLRWKN
ncbi:putative disease resistance protein RGA4 isoform X2 [Miscanthus floridulus]|uniref:putative disease resistance protein RGA4 isoform X2 n=1 Tax=Miscanthus floridulus TaxID=154761 RepID=UPI003457C34D